MTKRMIIMLALVGLLFGGIFGFKAFIGVGNYARMLFDAEFRGPFLSIVLPMTGLATADTRKPKEKAPAATPPSIVPEAKPVAPPAAPAAPAPIPRDPLTGNDEVARPLAPRSVVLLCLAPLAAERLGLLLHDMARDPIALPEKVAELRDALAEHFQRPDYLRCDSMGALIRENLESIRQHIATSPLDGAEAGEME